MKIKESEIENKKILQIYLSREEKESIDVQNQINKLQKENVNLVLFVSGNSEVEKTLQEMIKIMKNVV